MNLLDRYTPVQLLLVGLVSSLFIIYPNIASLSWELTFWDESNHTPLWISFFFRYIYFVGLIWVLLSYNRNRIHTPVFMERFMQLFVISAIAYGLYVVLVHGLGIKAECFTTILIFQFFVVCLISTFVGHVSGLYAEQRKKDQEIEQLKIENLQSRCDALANQINPHFFFNSLNGLMGLIRKREEDRTIEYVSKLSDIFRYILQSEKKGLVSLGEELTFVHAFRYMMEIRFAHKLSFKVEVPETKRDLKIPVLSLLPLIDNVVIHNTIDSQHKMEVLIFLNSDCELVVSNPIYPKLMKPDTNGTGLRNLENRFSLMMVRKVRVENDGKRFTVYLPLMKIL